MAATVARVESAESRKVAARASYIVGPAYDWLLFLLPPALALVLGMVISTTDFAHGRIDFAGKPTTWSVVVIGVFIHAHLVIVFFRSHGNAGIRRLYPYRFLAAPLVLYALMISSTWALITVSVLTVFWDVYHSALQTFGFARIYDRKLGNDPDVGRRLDWWLNQLLYVGPIVAGVTMLDHFDAFHEFENVGAAFFTQIPAFMESQQRIFTRAILAAGGLFVVGYVIAYWRLHRQGYLVSPLKVYLLASTGIVSIWAWGFNSFGEAFFIMNFFHALQYFGIVWAFEQKNIMKLIGVQALAGGKWLAIGVLIVPAAAYGLWVQTASPAIVHLWAITLVVSIMHFWYDGFIWSVRRSQV